MNSHQQTSACSRQVIWRRLLGSIPACSLGLLVFVSALLPATARDSHTLSMGGGGGAGTIPPLSGSAPNLFTLIPIDPAQRYILAQVTIADPHHRAVLRSPHGDRVVLPSQRTRDGLFVFVVGEDTHWLLTVTGSDVVDLTISAGSDVTIVLP